MESNNKWLKLVEEVNSKIPDKIFNLKEFHDNNLVNCSFD
jgi:hypothetical protein